MRALAQQPTGDLALFFTAHGLGTAFSSGSKGGDAHRLAVALQQAEREHRLDEVLTAAAAYFGLPPAPSAGASGAPRSDAGHAPDDQHRLIHIVAGTWVDTGRWPVARRLQRDLFRRGIDLDVEAAARGLDSRLGVLEQGGEGRVLLRVAGLALHPEASPYLNDFLVLVQALYRKYVEDDSDEPSLSSDELAADAGFDDEKLRRAHDLLEREYVLAAGGSAFADGRWVARVSDRIRDLRDVRTVDDYQAVIDRLMTPTREAQIPPPPRRSPGGASGASVHPIIAGAAAALYGDGHYAQAVFEAYKAVEIRVRELSGLDLIGKKLMSQAFGGGAPPLPLTDRRGIAGRNDQEGYALLLMGAMQAIRNEGGHATGEWDGTTASEALAFASLLMRRLDGTASLGGSRQGVDAAHDGANASTDKP